MTVYEETKSRELEDATVQFGEKLEVAECYVEFKVTFEKDIRRIPRATQIYGTIELPVELDGDEFFTDYGMPLKMNVEAENESKSLELKESIATGPTLEQYEFNAYDYDYTEYNGN